MSSNSSAARARGSGREARPEPAAAPGNSMRSDIFVEDSMGSDTFIRSAR